MEKLGQDLRYALRGLRRDLGFATVVVLTLGMGIGLNTAVFSVVRSVLLQPLPYPHGERLVSVHSEIPVEGVHDAPSGHANVLDLRERSRTIEDLATYDPASVTLTDGEWPEKTSAMLIGANFFAVLGSVPALGRTFTEEEVLQRAPLVVLSHALWQRRLGGSVDAIGGTIEIGGASFEVIGVMPETFPDRETQLWLPETVYIEDPATLLADRGTGAWRVVGRLRPGVELGEARDELTALASELEQAFAGPNAGLRFGIRSLRDEMTGATFRVTLWTLFGAVAMVLLIATANGAHLMLARGVNRAHELCLRRSLGASTRRLLGQTLAESLLLTLGAAMVGLLLARTGLRLLVAVAPANLPRADEIGIDTAVLGYATGISVLVGIVFGIAPALGTARSPLSQVLRQTQGPSPQAGRHRLRQLLIIGQFALALVLVFGASLLVRSLAHAGRVDPGFHTDDILMANLSVESAERRVAFYEEAVREAGAIPGVVSASLVEDLLISGTPTRPLTIEGSRSVEPIVTSLRSDAVAGDFFRTLGVPLLAGRGFRDSDGQVAPPVAVVNETMAARFWPGESAIGRRFRLGGDGAQWIEVVGVAADMHRQGPEVEPIPQLFRPYPQDPSRNMVLLVRTEQPLPGLATTLRGRLAALDRTVPLYAVTTVDQAVGGYLSTRRFQVALLGLFSGIALVLAAIGIYGLMQYSVAARGREIGVRMAVGGTAERVTRMILREGLALALAGLVAGMAGALYLSRSLSSLVFGIAAFDAASLVLTSVVLLTVAAAACYLPARRAARVDPVRMLRGG